MPKRSKPTTEILTVEQLCSQPLVYRDQRVITPTQMDRLHQRPTNTAARAFSKHKDKMIQGEDYFRTTRRELTTLGVVNSTEGNPDLEVILLTESGYLMLVKTFRDALAWDVQRRLVRGYFMARAVTEDLASHPIILTILQTMQEQGKAITDLAGQMGSIIKSVHALAHQKEQEQDWRNDPGLRDRPRLFRLPELVRLWWPMCNEKQEKRVLRRWRSVVDRLNLNARQARDYGDIMVNELDAGRHLWPVLDSIQRQVASSKNQRRLPFPDVMAGGKLN